MGNRDAPDPEDTTAGRGTTPQRAKVQVSLPINRQGNEAETPSGLGRAAADAARTEVLYLVDQAGNRK